MLRILIFSLLFAFCLPQKTAAQLPGGTSSANDWKKAQQAVTVLRNDRQLLPLRRLDTLRVAHINIGSFKAGDFLATARQYLPVDQIDAPAALSADWLEAQRRRYNLILVEIEDINPGGQLSPVYQLGGQLQQLLQELPSVVFVHGDGTVFQAMPWLQQAEALLIGPARLPESPSVAAQIIFGGLPAQGRLLGPLPNTPFRRGEGVRWEAPARLSYTSPDYTGMDAALLADSITAIVEEGIRKGAFPGAQVLVARHGTVVYQQAFGYHTADSSRAVEMDDLYDLASITKIAGPLPALMQLHGQGKFDLDAPLKTYLPAFRFSDKGKLAFRPMLAHQAGLRPWIPYWQGTLRGHGRYPWKESWDKERINDRNFRWCTFRADSSRRFPIRVTDDLWLHRNYQKKIYKAIRKSPLEEEAGYRYSGLLFYLLPEVVERITGSDYQAYLQSGIYQRLGAATLGYNPLERFEKQRIVPTERDTFFRMQLLHGRVHDEGAAMMGGVSGNAGLFANANDLAKLMQLYLNKGYYGGEQLIDSATVAEFTRYTYSDQGNRRGLGFDKPMLEYNAEEAYIAEQAGPNSFGHSGYTGTLAWADPDSGLLLVFLSNRVYPTRANRKLYELDIRPRLHRVLYEAVLKER